MDRIWSLLKRNKPQVAPPVNMNVEVSNLERQVIAQSVHIETLRGHLSRMAKVIEGQRDRIIGLEKLTEASVHKIVEVETSTDKNQRQIKRLFYDLGKTARVEDLEDMPKATPAAGGKRRSAVMPFVAPAYPSGYTTIPEFLASKKLDSSLIQLGRIGATATKFCRLNGQEWYQVRATNPNGYPKSTRAYPINILEASVKQYQERGVKHA